MLGEAWNDTSSELYRTCTQEIAESNTRIEGIHDALRVFALHNMDPTFIIETKVKDLLEDVYLSPVRSDGLDRVISYLSEEADKHNTTGIKI